MVLITKITSMLFIILFIVSCSSDSQNSITEDMQNCATNEDCKLVTDCGHYAINKNIDLTSMNFKYECIDTMDVHSHIALCENNICKVKTTSGSRIGLGPAPVMNVGDIKTVGIGIANFYNLDYFFCMDINDTSIDNPSIFSIEWNSSSILLEPDKTIIKWIKLSLKEKPFVPISVTITANYGLSEFCELGMYAQKSFEVNYKE